MPHSIDFFVLQTLALLITAFLIPRLEVKGPLSGLFAVLVLAYVNSTIWDWALFLEVPNSLTAHSLILFVANGLLFWVLAKILPGVEIKGILPALVAPLVFSVTSFLLSQYLRDVNWSEILSVITDTIVHLRDNLKKT